jgi:subtilisin family serine protease
VIISTPRVLRGLLMLGLLAIPLSSLPAAKVAAETQHLSAGKPPKPRRIALPNTRSLEYRLSWGLSSIHADRALARGLNGSGVTVAMIDAGMTADSLALFGNVSPASVDLAGKRPATSIGDSHARQTATILAAPLDGHGTLGIAYGASLLSIRIDVPGSCETICYAHAGDLARGIDYALANGAKIIGVPMVGRNRLAAIEPALTRVAAAGAVIVAAAGNDGADQSSWPARYAADPRFRDAILVVGASDPKGDPAVWSNKAVGVATRYLMAPGEHLLVDCDSKTCKLVSGTSYSVPYVAGALSLLMAASSQISAQDAGRTLLASAADRGVPGIDNATGSGLLDVEKAVSLVMVSADANGRTARKG